MKTCSNDEPKVRLDPCLECGKAVKEGYYGRFGQGGVCSKTCNTKYEARPKDYGEPKKE